MIEEQIATWVTTIGFPIAAYLLIYFRMEKKIDNLTEAINGLAKEAGTS